MYIWMILAVFVTTLFAFNLHIRPDAKSLYADSQASTTVAKVTIWHDAMRDGLKKAYDRAVDEDIHLESDRYHIGLKCEPFIDDDGLKVEANDVKGDELSDKLRKNIVEGYMRLPLSDVLPGTKSKIYCVSEGTEATKFFSPTGTGSCQNGDSGSGNGLKCCYGSVEVNINGEMATWTPGLYLITIAPIPVKWQNRDSGGKATGMPNNELIHGIHKLSGKFYNGTDRLGYLTKDKGEYVIKSFGKKVVEIPAAIVGEEDSFQYEQNGKKYNCKTDPESKDPSDGDACIIYMSKINVKTANNN